MIEKRKIDDIFNLLQSMVSPACGSRGLYIYMQGIDRVKIRINEDEWYTMPQTDARVMGVEYEEKI